MEIRKIGEGNVKSFQPREIKREDLDKETIKAVSDKIEISSTAENWLDEILNSALEQLENNIQYDNSHPLSSYENRPIESAAEVLAELEYFRSDKFREEAYSAQANISPESVLSLFEGEILV